MEAHLPTGHFITQVEIMAPTLLITLTPYNNKQKVLVMAIYQATIYNEIATKLMDRQVTIKR